MSSTTILILLVSALACMLIVAKATKVKPTPAPKRPAPRKIESKRHESEYFELLTYPSWEHQALAQRRRLKEPAITVLGTEGDRFADSYETYIAALQYHCSYKDKGGFYGFVANDFNNEVDLNAMAVCRGEDGMLLGYIPTSELRDYRRWSGGAPMPCVGFIDVHEGELRGRVKIAHPCNPEFIDDVLTDYLAWMQDNLGPEYVPDTPSFHLRIPD
ncbi:MAG: hypothetical protein NC418_01825 [Muribaculaceae bacterium]|nr:hypothetical protein [Muribaculaceae bacterium]